MTASLREAAQMALEALVISWQENPNWSKPAAIEALRAALALPDAEPVAIPAGFKLVPLEPTEEMRRAATGGQEIGTQFSVQSLYRAMLAAAPQPAPILPAAYDQTALELCADCGWKAPIPGECCLNCERNKSAPVERKPLTDEEKHELWLNSVQLHMFAKNLFLEGIAAAEAAHNIKGAA